MLNSVFFDYFYLGVSFFIATFILIFSFSLLFKMNLLNVISTALTVCVILIAIVTMIKFFYFGLPAVVAFGLTAVIKEMFRQIGLKKQEKDKTEYKTNKE